MSGGMGDVEIGVGPNAIRSYLYPRAMRCGRGDERQKKDQRILKGGTQIRALPTSCLQLDSSMDQFLEIALLSALLVLIKGGE
jgi:hypothetical protein